MLGWRAHGHARWCRVDEGSSLRMDLMLRGLTATVFTVLVICCALAEERPRRIVLITLDTLRWDAFVGDALHPPAMPRVLAWAKQARVFRRHFAVSSSTGPTHASLLTGQPPWSHGLTRNGLILAGEILTIPERLKAMGFATGAVVASFPLHRRFGFNQGFDVYHDEFQQSFMGMQDWKGEEIPQGEFFSLADTTTDHALAMLDAGGDGDQFFWFHYFDPHAPYGDTGKRSINVIDIVKSVEGGPERVSETLREARRLYTQDVRFMDAQLDRLRVRLQHDEARFDTHIVMVADHGESFGENGVLAHGSRVSDEQIHVPLIIWSPAIVPGIETASTGSVDVARAILAIAEGDTGASAILSGPIADRRVFGMRSSYVTASAEKRSDRKRVIPAGSEFFCADNLRILRGNGSGVSLEDADSVDPALVEEVRRAFEVFEREAQAVSAEEVLDERTQAALRALGYLR